MRLLPPCAVVSSAPRRPIGYFARTVSTSPRRLSHTAERAGIAPRLVGVNVRQPGTERTLIDEAGLDTGWALGCSRPMFAHEARPSVLLVELLHPALQRYLAVENEPQPLGTGRIRSARSSRLRAQKSNVQISSATWPILRQESRYGIHRRSRLAMTLSAQRKAPSSTSFVGSWSLMQMRVRMRFPS